MAQDRGDRKRLAEAGTRVPRRLPRRAARRRGEGDPRAARRRARPLPSPPPPGLAQVFDLRFWSGDSSTRVVVDLERKVELKYDRIADPDRLFVDLVGTRLHPNLTEPQLPRGRRAAREDPHRPEQGRRRARGPRLQGRQGPQRLLPRGPHPARDRRARARPRRSAGGPRRAGRRPGPTSRPRRRSPRRAVGCDRHSAAERAARPAETPRTDAAPSRSPIGSSAAPRVRPSSGIATPSAAERRRPSGRDPVAPHGGQPPPAPEPPDAEPRRLLQPRSPARPRRPAHRDRRRPRRPRSRHHRPRRPPGEGPRARRGPAPREAGARPSSAPRS